MRCDVATTPDAHRLAVLVDGKPVSGCIEADTDEGWARRHTLTTDGTPLVVEGKPVVYAVTGRVEVVVGEEVKRD